MRGITMTENVCREDCGWGSEVYDGTKLACLCVAPKNKKHDALGIRAVLYKICEETYTGQWHGGAGSLPGSGCSL